MAVFYYNGTGPQGDADGSSASNASGNSAAAIAALNDKEFLAKSFAVNRDGKKQLQQGFEKLALQFVPSYANFVLVKVGDAARINLELLKRGVIVRPVAGDGLPEWLRVSIGLPHENQTFLDALTAVLKATPGP